MAQHQFTVIRIEELARHTEALAILDKVYADEKGWASDSTRTFPVSDLTSTSIDWLGVCADGRLIGLVRLLYEIPVELYASYGFKLKNPSFDVARFVRTSRIAEVGRFAVLPEFRREILAVAMLMRSAGQVAIERQCTHFITDVFEDDPNTPLGFHQRVLGFEEVATHDHGELNCQSRRITMLLDLHKAMARIEGRNGWLFRFLKAGSRPQAVPAFAS